MTKKIAMAGRPTGRTNSTVSAEEIICAWQTSEDVREVHAKLGGRISITALNSRVHLLRMKGIPLKSMRGARRRTYTRSRIEELKALAESFNGTAH